MSQGTATEGEEEPEQAEEEGEEGRTSRGMRDVIEVSKEEREDHERTHTPYRPWCRYCVQGRGRADHHRKAKEKGISEVPRISMDCFFMSKEDEKAHENPLIVMIDEETGEKYARAVGQKGIGTNQEMDWLIKDLREELKAWGHTGGQEGKLILKSDG